MPSKNLSIKCAGVTFSLERRLAVVDPAKVENEALEVFRMALRRPLTEEEVWEIKMQVMFA